LAVVAVMELLTHIQVQALLMLVAVVAVVL
jgi:hypothetical protein